MGRRLWLFGWSDKPDGGCLQPIRNIFGFSLLKFHLNDRVGNLSSFALVIRFPRVRLNWYVMYKDCKVLWLRFPVWVIGDIIYPIYTYCSGF